MVLIFESLDDVLNYTYTYPVEEWVMGEFRKRKKMQQNYFEFVEEFTLNHITYGDRKYGELEEEWRHLKLMLARQLYNCHRGNDFPHLEILILLDQALLLKHEGAHIPNLLR